MTDESQGGSVSWPAADSELHPDRKSLPLVEFGDHDALAMAVMQANLFGAAPVKVGRFTVQGRLGAGGMGVVYAAHDELLDREVALKLLHRARLAGGGDDRLLREAQAMARLSHPNIVSVFEVGEHAGQLFIAMEFVRGQTLGAWLADRSRTWPDVLRVLLAAGRGLAAAHHAGIVHRDFKPHNTLVGADGSVKVADFGLARSDDAAAEADAASTQRMRLASLTRQGAVVGTPAYMAPEQHAGRRSDECSDQFSFCVTAWQALYGSHPFPSGSLAELLAAVAADEVRPPPPGSKVPTWLRRALVRGLAADPARRWPTMTVLLTALERGQARARLRRAVAALAAVAVLVAGVEAHRRWDLARRVRACEATGAAVDAVWNDDARQRLRAAFLATGVHHAGTTADKVTPWLDRQADAWRQARTGVCINTDVRGQWGAELADRAAWCLEDRRIDLASLVAEFGRATSISVQESVTAVAGLRTVDACMDEDLLRRQPAPPTHGREAVQAVRAEVAAARALDLAGDRAGAVTAAVRARERAEHELDWPPLLAAARAQEGYFLSKADTSGAAEAATTTAYFEAATAGAWEVAAGAAIELIGIVGYDQARRADGRAWARHAEMALGHAGDPGGLLAARRLSTLAGMAHATGAYAEARGFAERALALLEAALGPDHPDVGTALANLAAVRQAEGAYAEALALGERALAVREAALGPDHPDIADNVDHVAIVHHSNGDFAASKELFARALAIKEKALAPDNPSLATSLSNLASAHWNLGAFAESRALNERALAIREAAMGPDHPGVATILNNLALVHSSTGAYAEAEALQRRALVIYEKALGPDHPDFALGLNNLARVHLATGAYAEARPLHTRALAIDEKVFGPDHPSVAASLSNLAAVDLAEGRPATALPLLERAVVIFDAHAGLQRGDIRAHFDLARAIVATDGDAARAVALARAAGDELRRAGAGRARELAEVEAWLAAHAS